MNGKLRKNEYWAVRGRDGFRLSRMFSEVAGAESMQRAMVARGEAAEIVRVVVVPVDDLVRLEQSIEDRITRIEAQLMVLERGAENHGEKRVS